MRLERDAIANPDPPPRAGRGAHRLDHSHRFVTGNHRIAAQSARHRAAGILLDVAATQAAGLHAQQSFIGADGRDLDVAHLELAIRNLHHGVGLHGPTRRDDLLRRRLRKPNHAMAP